MPEPSPVTRALLQDGALALRAHGDAWNTVAAWVPRVESRDADPARVRAWIDAVSGGPPVAPPGEPPAFHMRASAGWLLADGRVLLRGESGRVESLVDPAALHARVRVPAAAQDDGLLGVEIFEGLTLPAAVLLGRIGRALVHAGAVVAPDGRAWLVAGRSFSGKSTTCLTLVGAGWNYLADDHVLLGRRGDGTLWVEGWLRPFNLDVGYDEGVSRGVRRRVDPRGFGPGRWQPVAPLGGLLFTRVEAEHPSRLEPLTGAEALARLLEQSPWLLTDRDMAAPLLGLLGAAARFPVGDLRLGRDCYRDPRALQHALLPLLTSERVSSAAPEQEKTGAGA